VRRAEEQYGTLTRDDLAAGGHGLLGAVCYRADRLDLAARHLERAVDPDLLLKYGHAPEDTIEALFFLAMTYQRQGRPAEARQTFARAAEELEKVLRDPTTRYGWSDPFGGMELRALRREAETLLRVIHP
jgi:hypothetical protein